MGFISLPELSIAVRQRADLGGQQNAFGQNSAGEITDAELSYIIQQSLAKQWDIQVQKFGDFYAWGDNGTGSGQGYIIPVVQGVYRYLVPWDFYKEQGVDLALDNTLQNWATVRPYTLRDRNLFSFPLQTVLAYAGWQNMRWQLQGRYLNFLPQLGPLPGTMRLMYTPLCPTLVVQPSPGAPQAPYNYPQAPATSTPYDYGTLITVTVSGVNQVFAAIVAGTSGGTAPGTYNVPGTTADGTVVWGYKGPLNIFLTTWDGISGYEELCILDAAIRCRVKQEADASALMQQYQGEFARLEYAAANRNAGDPMVVSGGFGSCEGGPAYGNGFGPFGGW